MFVPTSTSLPYPHLHSSQFDEIPGGIPGQGLSPVPNPQNGLRYVSYGLGSPSLTPVRLNPNTPNQYAISNPQREVLFGGGSRPTITRDYPNSIVKVFDLISLFIGCTLDDNSGTTTPTGCTLQFTGFKASDGSTTGPFNANYVPPNTAAGTVATQANMTQIVLPYSFRGLKNVTVIVVGSAVGGVPVANVQLITQYLDTIKTVLYSCC